MAYTETVYMKLSIPFPSTDAWLKGISWNNVKTTAQLEKSFFIRHSILLPWLWFKHFYFPTLQSGSKMKGLMHATACMKSLQAASNIFLPLSILTSVRTLQAMRNLKSCLQLKPSSTLPNILVQYIPAKYCFVKWYIIKQGSFAFFSIRFKIPSTLNYYTAFFLQSKLKKNPKTFPMILVG